MPQIQHRKPVDALKSVPLSVRVSPEDAAFLDELRIDGALNPSEKLRALVRNERRRREGYRDYDRVLGLVRETFAPTIDRIHRAENHLGQQSEFVHQVFDWFPDALAVALTSVATPPAGASLDELREMEARLADRVFRLLEATLRLGVTPRFRGYDPNLVQERLEPVIELLELIRSAPRR